MEVKRYYWPLRRVKNHFGSIQICQFGFIDDLEGLPECIHFEDQETCSQMFFLAKVAQIHRQFAAANRIWALIYQGLTELENQPGQLWFEIEIWDSLDKSRQVNTKHSKVLLVDPTTERHPLKIAIPMSRLSHGTLATIRSKHRNVAMSERNPGGRLLAAPLDKDVGAIIDGLDIVEPMSILA